MPCATSAAPCAPASPSASAICRPRPREPPVTSAVLPVRSNSCRTGVLIALSFLEDRSRATGIRLRCPRDHAERTTTRTAAGRRSRHAGDPQDMPEPYRTRPSDERDADAERRTGRRRSAPRPGRSMRVDRDLQNQSSAIARQVSSRVSTTREPGVDARQLVAEEVAAGGEQAADERFVGAAPVERRLRADRDVEPDPGDHERGRRPAGRASRWRAPPRERRSPRRRLRRRLTTSADGAAQRLGVLGERGDRHAPARSSRRSRAGPTSRPAPPSITTLRPSRSSAWMPCVPSWIMFRRLSRQYCSTGKSRV